MPYRDTVVYQDQTIVDGSTVMKLRFLSDINVQGKVIPKNSFVYGTARLSNERLDISIADIRYKNDILFLLIYPYTIRMVWKVSLCPAPWRYVLSQTFDGIPVPQVGGGFLSRPSTFEEWITQQI